MEKIWEFEVFHRMSVVGSAQNLPAGEIGYKTSPAKKHKHLIRRFAGLPRGAFGISSKCYLWVDDSGC